MVGCGFALFLGYSKWGSLPCEYFVGFLAIVSVIVQLDTLFYALLDEEH